jgi:hypothetical protein
VVAVGDDRELKLQIVRLWEISRQIRYMDFLEGGELSVVSKFLLRQGYVARPYFTQIVDIRDLDIVKRGVRKSYKSLINKTSGVHCVTFGEYRKIHQQAGGEDRCDESWHIQEEMVRRGKAFCVRDGYAIVLVYYNAHIAYYAGGKSVAANSHAALWHAMETARQLGCKYFEMGEQIFHGDKKLVNISKFKAGYGGRTVTRLILEPK